jgi:hypothetical protein
MHMKRHINFTITFIVIITMFLFYYKQCEKTYRVQLIEKNKSNNLFKYK